MQPRVIDTDITRIAGGERTLERDVIVMEEPLEVRVAWVEAGSLTERNVAITMRTPGNDGELATGFLFTEGVISGWEAIAAITQVADNAVRVTLTEGHLPQLSGSERNFYTTSSCGVCGKASIDAVMANCKVVTELYPYDGFSVRRDVLIALPAELRSAQALFEQTGGIHACAVFGADGQVQLVREDVGRHNALDKLIGAALAADSLPMQRHILLLSGRVSFELMQKAMMAGIKVIAAVGAPSSLAVQMAEDWNVTLVGFLRGDRFNVYSGSQRIVI
jgi:FdhD protein